MIDLKNTEIAFISKSDKDLRKARLMYMIMASRTITRTAKVLAKFAQSIRFPVNWAVKPTIYQQFVGGETIEECKKTVENNAKFNVKSILDYSVEGGESKEAIESALQETLRTIDNAANNPNIAFAVFKPTAFTTEHILNKMGAGETLTDAEKTEVDDFINRVDTLCKKAFDLNVRILIDAEDSWYQNFIDETVEKMMQKYNKEKAVVFNTWQMYRWDRLDHLKMSYQKALDGNYYLGAKFVRGAYMEKERARALKMGYKSPICETKEETDLSYNDALRFSFEHRDRVSIFNGTHNEESSLLLADLMLKENVNPALETIWFSQLLGMSDHISFNLAKHGFNVTKYLPYGPVKHVLPYLFRRAEENTSVKGQTGRELSLLSQEAKRRKSK
jgi:proline dehydrogenase